MSEWISTADRYPPEYQWVLTWSDEGGYMDIGRHNGKPGAYDDGWETNVEFGFREPSHWMERPEPPEVKDGLRDRAERHIH